MANSYAPKLSPVVGNGLGGLPKKKEGLATALATIIYFDSGAGEFKIPAGYSQVRIVAVGPGGTSSGASGYTGGAGGGGLAATNIIKVNEGDTVTYSVGVPADVVTSGVPSPTGTPTTVKFKEYNLFANSGGPTNISGNPYPGGIGGAATGGDVNFSGGNGGTGVAGGYGGGGGAAGLGSIGGNGANYNAATATPPTIISGDLAGGGGGASGAIGGAGGGGGSGARGSGGYDGTNAYLPPHNITSTRNAIGLTPPLNQSSGRVGCVGGQAGGGAAGGGYIGGTGCVRIELWP